MNSSQYDALVIGGGPAGSTAALVMARAGLWVRLLESSAFPRFHVGESLLPRFSLFAENPAQSIDQPAFAGAG